MSLLSNHRSSSSPRSPSSPRSSSAGDEASAPKTPSGNFGSSNISSPFYLTLTNKGFSQELTKLDFAMDNRDSCLFSDMSFLIVAISFIIGISTLIMIRIFYVIYQSSKPLYCKPPGPLSTLIVLGSGGHNAEMLNLLAVMQMERFKPKYYIAAATDNMSLHNMSLQRLVCSRIR